MSYTAGCKGCTIREHVRKSPEVAAMQDLLVYVTRGLSAVTSALRAKGESVSRGVNSLVATNMFHTIRTPTSTRPPSASASPGR